MKKDSSYHFFSRISTKYSSFLELLLEDTMYGCYWKEEEYDEVFALVLGAEERCRIRKYLKRAVCGYDTYCSERKQRGECYGSNKRKPNNKEKWER